MALPRFDAAVRKDLSVQDGAMASDPKDVLKNFLQGARDTLI